MRSGSQPYLPWVDVLRIIGCLCVLATHVEYAGGHGGGTLVALIDYFGIAGFMPFFFISGMFAFGRQRPMRAFFSDKLRRIVFPMVIWSVVYLMAMSLAGLMDWDGFLQRVLLIPFKPQVPQFWYLYVLVGVYLLTPVLSQWLASATRRQVEFYLLLWAVTLFVPFIDLVLPGAQDVITRFRGVLFYFQGFLGVMLLGYYLHRYVDIHRPSWWFWPVLLLLLSVPLWYGFTPVPLDLLNDYLSPNMLAISVALFIIVRCIRWPSWSHRLLNWLGQCSYGVYLMHMIVIRIAIIPLLKSLQLNYWLGMPLGVLLSGVILLLLVWLLSHLRWAWMLGCSLKKL